MSGNYTRIYTLEKQNILSGTDCPVTIEAGALLFDNTNRQALTQLKFKNNTMRSVKEMEVVIKTFDLHGNKIVGDVDFIYENLVAPPGEFFGSQIPVYMSDNNSRTFRVEIINIEFSDGSVWNKFNEQAIKTAKQVGKEAVNVAKIVAEKATDADVGKVAKKGASFILNCAVFFLMLIFTIGFMVTILDANYVYDRSDYTLGIAFALSTIISFPAIGSLLPKKIRFVRWIIIAAILLIAFVLL